MCCDTGTICASAFEPACRASASKTGVVMSRQPALNQIGFALEHQPMTRFQTVAVAICMVLNAIDGFDVLAIAFAAPVLSREWSLPPGQLGVLFSSGLLGMTLGSLFIAPLADRFGRRWMILTSLVGVTLG